MSDAHSPSGRSPSGRSPSGPGPAGPGAHGAAGRGPQRLRSLLARPRSLLVLVGLLAALAAVGMSRLRNEDDILVFLPQGDTDVAVFKDVAKRFGALRVALIGVRPRDGGSVFRSDLLRRIDRLSRALENSEGVDRVLSLTKMTDMVPSDFGVEIKPLVPPEIPEDAAALKAIEQRALSQPTIRGNIVSADGTAALVMVFLVEGQKTQALTDKARALSQKELAPVAELYFGGAPFAGPAIYDDTQQDVRRLTPLSLILFFGVVLLAFRDAVPVALTVVTVGLSAALVLGGMGLLGEPFTVVTGTLPLVFFASGSQYAIHILGRYYLIRAEQPRLSPLDAAVAALRIAGPPVTVAAVNCCLGFLSFLVMNISAMRAFGVACSLGVVLCWLLSVTVLPSVAAAWPGSGGKGHVRFTALGGLLQAVFDFAQRRRWLVVGASGLLALLCAGGMTRVQVRMEPRAFFRPGSEPALAQEFLDTRFGGAQFAQVVVEGDLKDPRTLQELRRLTAFARALPGVTQVQSIVQPLALVNESMAGMRGLPSKAAQVGTLYSLIGGEASLRTLVTSDQSAALVHVRLLGEAAPVLAGLRDYLKARWPFALRRPTAAELAEELGWLLPASERPARAAAVLLAAQRIEREGPGLAGPLPAPAATPAGSGTGADAEADPAAAADAEAARLSAAQKKAVELLMQALGLDPGTQAAQLHGRPSDEVRAEIELCATALLVPTDEGPAQAPLRASLTGEPMLDQAFSRAVDRNQWASLGIALISVLVALLIAQRSLGLAILSMAPAVMALLVVFGGLGLLGRPIDLGTSLVGSIVTSSGADFAMHYIWYLRQRPAREVVPTVGPVIFTTAVLLGLGMGVMMLGGAPPIRLFGGLSCAGMVLSAAFTFLLVPALMRTQDKRKQDKE
ncbi:MAG: MMPL family transporter [Polyangia bacterium]